MNREKTTRGRLLLLFATGAFVLAMAALPTRGDEPDEEEASPITILRERGGLIVLTADAETQERIALEVSTVQAIEVPPAVVAYGVLEADPAQTFTLRAPVEGIVRTEPGTAWPTIGSPIEQDAALGYLEPRFTALETIDLRARRLDAQAELDSIAADAEATRASFESKSRLNAEDGLVSDRSMEETRAHYKSSEARLVAARKKVELFEALTTGKTPESTLFPLTAQMPGHVIEIGAQDGETVSAGQVLLRTARFDAMIANISLPIGVSASFEDTEAAITVVGETAPVLAGRLVGPAPMASASTGGESWRFRVEIPASAALRPGAAIKAYIPAEGAALRGVVIPRSALVRLGGQTWAYVKTDVDRFERRPMVLDRPTAGGWVATSGAAAGERVVTAAAQMLLSEELKAQIENEEAAGE